MTAPVFQLADFGNSASGTITRQKDIGVTLRVDVDDVSFDYGTGGGWDRTAIVWYWDDDAAPEWKYNVHLGGWVSGHSWGTTGTKTMWCALVNGDSRFSVVTAVNTGGDVAGAVDAAVTAGEATKVTRTIDVIDTLTEIYYDFVNGDDANPGTTASPKKNLPTILSTADRRHICVDDQDMVGRIVISDTNIILDLRNGATLSWASRPGDECITVNSSAMNVAVKRDTNVGPALCNKDFVSSTTYSMKTFGAVGLTLENIASQGVVSGFMFALTGPADTVRGDILSYRLRVDDVTSSQNFWLGNPVEDSGGNAYLNTSPLNNRHFVAYKPHLPYGSRGENGIRGIGRFVTLIDLESRQPGLTANSLNWRESGNWLFGDELVDVEINTFFEIPIDGGTGVTTGTYRATEKGTDPTTGKPAVKFTDSISTSNVDLLNDDIEITQTSGWKSSIRLQGNQYVWIRGATIKMPVWPYGDTAYEHGRAIAGGPNDISNQESEPVNYVVIERSKSTSGQIYGGGYGAGQNFVIVRASICDQSVPNGNGYVDAELSGDASMEKIANAFMSQLAAGGGKNTAVVGCTHKANAKYSSFCINESIGDVDVVNNLQVNPLLEVYDDSFGREHSAIYTNNFQTGVLEKRTTAKWDESTSQLYVDLGTQFSVLGFPAFSNSGVRIEITGGTGVTIGTYTATSVGTHAGTGEAAIVLSTSISTSNVDLTTGDIAFHVRDTGLWLFKNIANNQFSPFAVDPGGFNQSGNKFFRVEDLNNDDKVAGKQDIEDVDAFNARAFASGNVVQLAALLSDYYPSSNVITAPPDTRCFEDYYGNPMDGSLEVVGAVSETTSAGPALTNATIETVSDTSISATVTTDTASGTLYRYVSLSATAPSTSDHKAGTGSVSHDTNTVTATGQQTLSDFIGLTADTLYYVHFLQDDGAGNDSLTASDFTTTTSPSVIATLSNAVVTATSSDTLAFSVDTDTGSGDAYAYLSTSATPPSEADLINGTGAVQHQTVSVGSTGTINFSDFTGLSAETTYWVHFIQVNDENSNIVTGSDTTPASGVGPSLTSPSASAIGQDTMTASCVSDTLDGTVYVYYSTNATPPSESDLINGTGSVAHETEVL